MAGRSPLPERRVARHTDRGGAHHPGALRRFLRRPACGHVDNAYRVITQAHRPYDESHPDSLTHLTGRIRRSTLHSVVAVIPSCTLHSRMHWDSRIGGYHRSTTLRPPYGLKV